MKPAPILLLLFSKQPGDKNAKTRLREQLSDSFVDQLHEALVTDTLSSIRKAVSNDDTLRPFCAWARCETIRGVSTGERLAAGLFSPTSPVTHLLQTGETFVDRLEQACLSVFDHFSPPPSGDHTPAPLIVIGSDAPQLGPDHLLRAAEELRSGKFVLTPAPEGGIALFGIPAQTRWKALKPAFKNPLESVGISELYHAHPLALLPPRTDIDLPRDLSTVKAELHLESRLRSERCWFPEETWKVLCRQYLQRQA
ncbi:DUF2064 domain-containing protein [bacterium]|nr:DUF2064 domain-containing protein [bacterium]